MHCMQSSLSRALDSRMFYLHDHALEKSISAPRTTFYTAGDQTKCVRKRKRDKREKEEKERSDTYMFDYESLFC